MKIILVSMQWNYNRPEEGHSFEYWNFHEPLRRIIGQDMLLPYDFADKLRVHGRQEAEATLVECVKSMRPNLVLFIPFAEHSNPSRATWDECRKVSPSTKFWAWSCDSSWRYEKLDRPLAAIMDKVVSTSGAARAWYERDGLGDKYAHCQWAVDLAQYPDAPLGADARCIDVSFTGQGYGKRKEYLESVSSAARSLEKTACFRGGEIKGGRCSRDEMIAMYLHSRLVINFTSSWQPGPPQLKARLFEAAACGAAVLQEEHPELQDCFESRDDATREVLTWSGGPDELGKCVHSALQRKDLLDIGRRARVRVESDHTWKRRWTKLLPLVGGV